MSFALALGLARIKKLHFFHLKFVIDDRHSMTIPVFKNSNDIRSMDSMMFNLETPFKIQIIHKPRTLPHDITYPDSLALNHLAQPTKSISTIMPYNIHSNHTCS